MTAYAEFIERKNRRDPETGFEPRDLSPMLYPFQRDLTEWALRRGRGAIFADCGLGKTPMQLEWAKRVYERGDGDVLIVAPLAVSAQTVREGEKFDVEVTACREVSDVRSGVNITNYERLERFMDLNWAGIVLDESSILKSFDGKPAKKGRLLCHFEDGIVRRG
jgi:superfamily II DNA or RNA helicase